MSISSQSSSSHNRNIFNGLLTNGPLWILLSAVAAAVIFWDGLISLGIGWARPEYSYGPLVPFITLYISLREIQEKPIRPDHGSRWPGFALLILSLMVGILGNMARIPDVITYGFILYVGAVILMVAGTREGFRFWPGWLHLIFMLPLPQFFYLHVSTTLQFISSQIGVGVIRLADIPVYLDGNVIDLGVYKLQVAEACSGLRYLFPLFSFGWLIAVLYRGPAWHKVIIFLSVVPVTIFMNSFRIGMIGILVNYYGIEQAEGFLHSFEGWIIFIACTVILYAEAWILLRFFSFGRAKSNYVLDFDMQGVIGPLKLVPNIRTGMLFATGVALTFVVGLAWQLQPAATTAAVSRLPLGVFPMQIGDWQGRATFLDRDIERVLGADDYLVADYSDGTNAVNVLMTFYRSQTEGEGIHSPEVCIPGGGWEVSAWEQIRVPVDTGTQTRAIPVNRAIIQKGLSRQLVYYWFEQRGQQATNDYQVKMLSIWDTITVGRSDGGLIRLITPIAPNESEAAAAERLQGFLAEYLPEIDEYFPSL